MKIGAWPCWCLLLMAGCQSDTDRLREAEHRFLEIVALPEKHPLTAGKDTLFLPVLPAPEAANRSKNDAAKLQKKIQSIDPQKLVLTDQQRLKALGRAVDDLVLNGVATPIDRVCAQVAEPFQMVLKLDNPELTQRFLTHLPVYFAEMEQRWQPPLPQKVPQTIREAESAFDALQELEQRSPQEPEKFAMARMALKDYIGLCQSALLSRQ